MAEISNLSPILGKIKKQQQAQKEAYRKRNMI